MRRGAACCLALTAGVVGCGPAPEGPRAASPARPPEAQKPAPPAAAEREEAGVQTASAVVIAALGAVSRARELAVKGEVRGVALSRAEMAARVRTTIEKEVPPEVMTAQAEMLIALGTAPADFDYGQAIVTLMSAQLAGYYEPSTKTMYLASDLAEAEREATLAHELVHALQDQHYNLENLVRYRPDQSDVQSAAHALAEGDATSAMFDQMLAPRAMKATDLSEELIGLQVRAAATFGVSGPGVPDVLKRSLVSPYVDGIEFVHFLRRRGGWAAVDAAWSRPPSSTEQLLHPDKYLSGELPVAVAVPPPPEAAIGEPGYTDVLGEQSLRLLLEEWMPRASAVKSSAGWAGDRLAVWRFGERVAVAWHLVADDVASATRSEGALLRGVAAQRDPGAKGPSTPCAERAALGPLLVRRKGREVVVIAGPYQRQKAVTKAASTCEAASAWADRILAIHKH
jgi:hypothetical protein